MSTQKFQLRYSAVEDRILIVVTDEDGQDEVFGLTRRLVKRLVPSVEKVLKQAGHLVQPPVPDTQSPAPGQTPAETLAFNAKRKSAAAPSGGDADAEAAEQDAPAPVAPVTSRLVTRLRVSDHGRGRHVLHMTDGHRELDVPLSDEQLAQFSHGIVTVLGNADWDLAPVETGEAETETGGARIDITTESPSKYHH